MLTRELEEDDDDGEELPGDRDAGDKETNFCVLLKQTV